MRKYGKKLTSLFLTAAMAVSLVGNMTTPVDANAEAARITLRNYLNSTQVQGYKSEIHTYGTRTINSFNKAFDYATLVVDTKAGASEEEIVSAHYMLRSTLSTENLYRCATLSTCQARFKSDFDTLNNFNADADNIYTSGSWDAFTTAYNNITQNIHSGDSSFVTDLCIALKEAHADLVRKDIVTREEYNALRTKIVQIIALNPAQGRNRFTDERRPKDFDKEHDHISLVCKSTPRWGTAWLAFDHHRPLFDAQREEFQGRRDTRTTNDAIVYQYYIMRKIVECIEGFVPDEFSNASEQNFRTILRDRHNDIVDANNNRENRLEVVLNPRLGIQDTPLAALAQLYAVIAEQLGSSFKWVSGMDNGNAGTIEIRPNMEFFIVSDNQTGEFKRAALTQLAANVDSDSEKITHIPRNSTPEIRDLREFVGYATTITAQNRHNILINSDSNHFVWFRPSDANGDIYEPTYNDLITIWSFAYQLENAPAAERQAMSHEFWRAVTGGGNNATGGMTELAPSATGTMAFVYRLLRYTLDDYRFPNADYTRTKAQLQNLVRHTEECCLTLTQAPFFKPYLAEIDESVSYAIDVLARQYNAHQVADKEDEMDYYEEYMYLKWAIDDFHEMWKLWTYSVQDAYELILTAHKSGNAERIKMAEKLANELLLIDHKDSDEVWVSHNDVLLYGRLANIPTRPEYRAYLAAHALSDIIFNVCDIHGNIKTCGCASCYPTTVVCKLASCDACQNRISCSCAANCMTKRYSGTLGHILGNATVTTSDALEILKYIVNLPGAIASCNNARKSATITDPVGGKISTTDALEILKKIVGLPNKVDGTA